MPAQPGDLPIDPNVVDGTELAARLNRILPDVASATAGLDAKVNKSGDTMTGALTLSSDAVSPLQAVPLQQLQAVTTGLPYLPLTGGDINGFLNVSNRLGIGGQALSGYVAEIFGAGVPTAGDVTPFLTFRAPGDNPRLNIDAENVAGVQRWTIKSTSPISLKAGVGGVKLSGVTDGSNAAAGEVGEYIQTTTLYSSVITSAVLDKCGILVLPAGDWDVQGSVTFNAVSVTGITRISVGFGDNSLSFIPGSVTAQQYASLSFNSAASSTLAMATTVTRVSTATGTTINLIQYTFFGGGTLSVSSIFIGARRVR